MCDIDKERKLEIEKKVDNLISNIDFKKTPFVDITSIVKQDGFDIELHEMDIETTGCLFIVPLENDEQKRTIWVNTIFKNPDNEEDVVFKKSRFITAHEYGHFKLHHALTAHRDTYHRTESIELEADYFARSILMPLKYFKACYDILSDFSRNDEEYTAKVLSEFFRVTVNKVNKRIGDLKELYV